MNDICKYKQEFKVFVSEQKPSVKMNYLLAYPEDRKTDECLPLLVFLHGAGERGTDPKLIKVNGVPQMLDTGLNIRAVILAPQVPDERHVWNTLCDETMELIRLIRDTENIDPDRVSLTGISMGGYGTWELASSYDREFSAIAPMCGGGMDWRGGILKDMPIRAFHGDKDTVVSVENTRLMIDSINASGGSAAFMILHGIDHSSWIFAYEQTNVLQWLVAADRKNKGKGISSWADIK